MRKELVASSSTLYLLIRSNFFQQWLVEGCDTNVVAEGMGVVHTCFLLIQDRDQVLTSEEALQPVTVSFTM
jgi:hypothetical protein